MLPFWSKATSSGPATGVVIYRALSSLFLGIVDESRSRGVGRLTSWGYKPFGVGIKIRAAKPVMTKIRTVLILDILLILIIKPILLLSISSKGNFTTSFQLIKN